MSSPNFLDKSRKAHAKAGFPPIPFGSSKSGDRFEEHNESIDQLLNWGNTSSVFCEGTQSFSEGARGLFSRSPSSALLPFLFSGRVPQLKSNSEKLIGYYSKLSTGGPTVVGRNPFRTTSESLVSDDSPVSTNKRYGFNHGFQVVRFMDFATIHGSSPSHRSQHFFPHPQASWQRMPSVLASDPALSCFGFGFGAACFLFFAPGDPYQC